MPFRHRTGERRLTKPPGAPDTGEGQNARSGVVASWYASRARKRTSVRHMSTPLSRSPAGPAAPTAAPSAGDPAAAPSGGLALGGAVGSGAARRRAGQAGRRRPVPGGQHPRRQHQGSVRPGLRPHHRVVHHGEPAGASGRRRDRPSVPVGAGGRRQRRRLLRDNPAVYLELDRSDDAE